MKKKLFVFTVPFLMATFLACIYLFTGCKKNVGTLTNIIKYDVTGYVLDAETVGIGGAEVFLDGVSVATTDASGKYVITKLLAGDYVIEAKKTGYVKNKSDLKVSLAGVVNDALMLKKLSNPVTVTPTAGATIVEKNPAGTTVVSLTIPPNAITGTAPVQISLTSLVGNETPAVPELQTNGHVPGVTVSLDCSNPNITFPTGITLNFALPFIHKPGTLQLVVTYNESSGKWESYPNAVVNSDGKSASLTIYHFSEWTLMVEAGLPLTVVPITPVKVDYPVGGKFTWSSTLIFPNGILADFSPSFLYGFVSDQTGLAFANYKNGSVTVPIGTGTIQNTLTISPSPNTNPVGFTDLPNIAWELVKYSYTVQGKITVQAFDIPTNGYVNREITCTFELPSYVWIWKESPSLEYPPRPYPGNYKKISQVVLSMQHQGGVGW